MKPTIEQLASVKLAKEPPAEEQLTPKSTALEQLISEPMPANKPAPMTPAPEQQDLSEQPVAEPLATERPVPKTKAHEPSELPVSEPLATEQPPPEIKATEQPASELIIKEQLNLQTSAPEHLETSGQPVSELLATQKAAFKIRAQNQPNHLEQLVSEPLAEMQPVPKTPAPESTEQPASEHLSIEQLVHKTPLEQPDPNLTLCMGPDNTSRQRRETAQNTDLTEGQCIDAEDDGVILQAVCLEKRYNTGDYIMIQHGQSFIPAVVDHWPWVKFFTKARKKGFGSLSEVKHTVVETDVDLKLPPPDITMCGTRLLYHFPEHNQKKQKHL